MPIYETYDLSRIVTVQAIVSADYIEELSPAENNHFHQDAWELCVCLEGEIQVSKASRIHTLEAGQSLFIQPGTLHDVGILHKGTAAFIVSFTCSGGDLLLPLQDTLLQVNVQQRTLLQNIIQELKTTFRQPTNALRLYRFTPNATSPLGAEQMICCYLELILISILREITMHHGEVVSSNQFQNAMEIYLAEQITAYIQAHLRERLTLDRICQHFHYSRARLCVIYRRITGLSIHERISLEQIQQAKALLLDQNKSVAQISEELGFSSPHYFSHKFTQEVGCAPSRYAAMMQKK